MHPRDERTYFNEPLPFSIARDIRNVVLLFFVFGVLRNCAVGCGGALLGRRGRESVFAAGSLKRPSNSDVVDR